MEKQFNNDLKNRISQVFDDFEDTGADEGWLLLREKFPEKEKDRGVFWLWFGSAAALLLLTLGIGTWVNLKKESGKKLSLQSAKKHLIKDSLATTAKIIHGAGTSNKSGADKLVISNNKLSEANKGAASLGLRVSGNAQATIPPPYVAKNSPLKNKAGGAPAKATANPSNVIANNSSGTGINTNKPVMASTVSSKNEKLDTIAAKANLIADNRLNHTVMDTVSKKQSVVMAQKPIIVKAPGDKGDELRFKQVDKQQEIKQKKVQFSVYAATYFNYAKGSDNQINIGAGVTSDIRLTSNLRLSTGVSVGQNSLNYNNQPAQSVSTYTAMITANGPPSTFNALGTANTSNTPVFKNYTAQLVGLDIPVNLKYEFNPQKNDSYFAIGLSSGTFINQQYTYQYNSFVAQPQTTNSSFSNFYLAKTLNVSFGIGYPVSKNNRLIIEPFLKYPLDGMGAQQIKFGAGGLNLKFVFTTSKK